MLLALDAGNTNITVGVLKDTTVCYRWRITSRTKRSSDEYRALLQSFLGSVRINPSSLDAAVISCVVPALSPILKSATQTLQIPDIFAIEPGIKLNFPVDYSPPSSLGADRIVNAVAVKCLFGYPNIIIDFGTATTFCIINPTGEYDGGVILPGLDAFTETLHLSTALLPRVPFCKPDTIIGKSTIAGIQAGLFFGYIDMINGILNRLEKAYNHNFPITVTGGLAQNVIEFIGKKVVFEPHLTLIGMALIYTINQNGSANHVW